MVSKFTDTVVDAEEFSSKDVDQLEAEAIEREPMRLVEDEFFTIKTKSQGMVKLKLNSVQKIVLAIIQKLLDEGKPIRMMVLKARQTGVCLDPDTRVLTSDLRWVYIDDIPIGQEIVTVDETGIHRKGRKLKVGTIVARRDVYEEAFKITMEDGRELIATPNHRFLCKRRNSVETQWRCVKDMRIDDVIRHITNPWDESDYEDGWFGGMIDGEGTVRKKERAGCEMMVCQRPGDVYNRARKYLKDNGYTFRESMDNRLSIPNGGKFSNNPVGRLTLGRMDELFRLVGKTRPSRFVNKKWWEGKSLPGRGKGCEAWCKIANIEPLKQQRMIDLQTSDKTFIAEGFVSHNSTLIEAIIYALTSQTKGINSMVIADDVRGSNYIFEMQKLYHETLENHLKPRLRHSNEKKLEFEGIHSQVLIDTAENKQAGRKFTLQYVHLSECAFFTDLGTIMTGLSNSVPNAANSMIILESTANGMGNAFYDRWCDAVEGKSDWLAIFIPWFELPEYKKALDKEEYYPIAGIKQDGLKFLREEKELQERHKLTNEQMNWRRWCIVNNCDGKVELFNQEYPSTWIEAFLMTGSLYFDKEALLKEENKARDHYQKAKKNEDEVIYKEGEIVLLDGKHRFRELQGGRFRMYETPSENDQYCIGGDSAEGLAHGDDSAFVVLNKRTNTSACVYNCTVDTDEFADDLKKAGKYFNNAMIGPENKGYGSAVCQKLYKTYGNIFRKIHNKTGSPKQTDELGWNTNVSTRPQMLAQMAEELREGATSILDSQILSQMRTFINDPKRKKPMAEEGKKDDLVVARAIAGMMRVYYPYVSQKDIKGARERYNQGQRPKPNQGYGFKRGD